jgi:hypothetical protein
VVEVWRRSCCGEDGVVVEGPVKVETVQQSGRAKGSAGERLSFSVEWYADVLWGDYAGAKGFLLEARAGTREEADVEDDATAMVENKVGAAAVR